MSAREVSLFWAEMRPGDAFEGPALGPLSRELADGGHHEPAGLLRRLLPDPSLPRLLTVLRGPGGTVLAHAGLLCHGDEALHLGDPVPDGLGTGLGLLYAWTRPGHRGRGLASAALATLGAETLRLAGAHDVRRPVLLAERRLLPLAGRSMATPVLARWSYDRPAPESRREETARAFA